ncbi:type II secretion system F family protein [Micromonospora mangrovi]|uniref:Type II secretion system F family protein n=1 Tax=Micromonospora mangrovi TaxID=1182597 RepID=A0ABV8MFF8_9ACTN
MLVSGVAAGVLAGPVAGVALAAYGGLGVRGVLRRQAHRRADLLRRRALEQLAGLAADLRAGLPVPAVRTWDGPVRVTALARAAVHLADRTGAPLAELLERVEADARAADRGLAAAAAQAAGARATAWLLAALPLGGIGLGYAIGADPVTVLLHTPIGGGSAVVAIGLQVAGLVWAERLGGTPGRAG